MPVGTFASRTSCTPLATETCTTSMSRGRMARRCSPDRPSTFGPPTSARHMPTRRPPLFRPISRASSRHPSVRSVLPIEALSSGLGRRWSADRASRSARSRGAMTPVRPSRASFRLVHQRPRLHRSLFVVRATSGPRRSCSAFSAASRSTGGQGSGWSRTSTSS